MKTERYKADYSLPPAFYRLERNPVLKYHDHWIVLQKISPDEMVQLRKRFAAKTNGQDLCGIPTYVAIIAGNMHLAPTPDEEMELEVLYTELPKTW